MIPQRPGEQITIAGRDLASRDAAHQGCRDQIPDPYGWRMQRTAAHWDKRYPMCVECTPVGHGFLASPRATLGRKLQIYRPHRAVAMNYHASSGYDVIHADQAVGVATGGPDPSRLGLSLGATTRRSPTFIRRPRRCMGAPINLGGVENYPNTCAGTAESSGGWDTGAARRRDGTSSCHLHGDEAKPRGELPGLQGRCACLRAGVFRSGTV